MLTRGNIFTRIIDLDWKSLTARCAQLINEAKCIGVLTGAGISTSAGIPDFRGPKGLYVTKKYDPEKVFDIDYFHRDPKPFYEFAEDFVTLEEKLKPTAAHYFLAELEKKGKLKGIVTQNIDSLHQLAGSQNVLEMHGSFWKSYCLDCQQEFSYDALKVKLRSENIPRCSCSGVIKPDIVFFGENVKYLTESVKLARETDLFFIIGTSCVVYPAATVPQYTSGKIVIVNMSLIEATFKNVALEVQGDIDQFFTELNKKLL